MKKISLILVICLIFVCFTACDSKNYEKAVSLFNEGEYEEAEQLFLQLGDYENSAEMLASCQKELMYQKYESVFELLKDGEWYFNGGSNTSLKCLSFSKETAAITEITFDGNGKHVGKPTYFKYIVDDKNITISLLEGSELAIPYTISQGNIKLGKNEYYQLDKIDELLQGYWRLRDDSSLSFLGINCMNEYNIYIQDGKIKYEHASEGINLPKGQYYYYGPYEASYSLNRGGLTVSNASSFDFPFFFNIINGRVTLLYYDKVCSDGSGLPGEYGYHF